MTGEPVISDTLTVILLAVGVNTAVLFVGLLVSTGELLIMHDTEPSIQITNQKALLSTISPAVRRWIEQNWFKPSPSGS